MNSPQRLVSLLPSREGHPRQKWAELPAGPDFRALFETTAGPALVLDRRLSIVVMSDAYARAVQVRQEDALGRMVFDVLPPCPEESMMDLRASLQRVLDTGEPDTAAVGFADGGERHWNFIISPSLGADGRLAYVVLRVEDVTEALELRRLRAANAALARSNRDLQHFAQMAAHDLQAPLRSIAGFTQLLRQEWGDALSEEAAGHLSFVVGSTRRMQTLIRDLLAYSTLESQTLSCRMTDLRPLVDEVLATLAAPTAEAKAEVRCGDLPSLSCDRGQLFRVLLNLVENALKYNRNPCPQVDIGAERRGGEWIIRVRDNGIGIAPRYHQRIFEIFRRLHGSQDYPGSGIGLATCSRIVERHGGRLWVESEEGEGSTFLFALPAERP